MKEFIWKVCCLIWHFDERVIREYKEREDNVLTQYKEEQYQSLKELEEGYWQSWQRRKEELDELETHKIQIEEDNFVPFHYGNILAKTLDYQNFWNDIYDALRRLGRELGKEEELIELRKKRH